MRATITDEIASLLQHTHNNNNDNNNNDSSINKSYFVDTDEKHLGGKVMCERNEMQRYVSVNLCYHCVGEMRSLNIATERVKRVSFEHNVKQQATTKIHSNSAIDLSLLPLVPHEKYKKSITIKMRVRLKDLVSVGYHLSREPAATIGWTSISTRHFGEFGIHCRLSCLCVFF